MNFFNQMEKVHSTIKSLECVDNNKMSPTNQPNQSRLVHQSSAALSTLNALVDNHFKCSSICCRLDTFEGPTVVIWKCLHRFCDDTCIKKSIQRCGAECATCRARITSRRDLRKDQLLEDIVSEKNVTADLLLCRLLQ